jgi:hypothetical protein
MLIQKSNLYVCKCIGILLIYLYEKNNIDKNYDSNESIMELINNISNHFKFLHFTYSLKETVIFLKSLDNFFICFYIFEEWA